MGLTVWVGIVVDVGESLMVLGVGAASPAQLIVEARTKMPTMRPNVFRSISSTELLIHRFSPFHTGHTANQTIKVGRMATAVSEAASMFWFNRNINASTPRI